MKVGYAVLYKDGTLTISKEHTILQTKIIKDYGEFYDTNIPWKNDYEKIKIVKILSQVKSNNMSHWFRYCKNLTALIDFQNLDVSDCIDFSCLFCGCYSLINISSLQNWTVSNGQDFELMFGYCKLLIDIISLSNWDTSSVEDFSSMFSGCKSLINISVLSNWNMSNGKDFDWIFGECFKLKEISLPNTLNSLTQDMFEYCNLNLKIHWKNKIYTYEDLILYNEF